MNILITNPAFSCSVGYGLERYKLGSGMRYPWSILKRVEQRPRYAMFPLFLAYTAAILEKNDFNVKVIDAVPLNIHEDELVCRIEKIDPDFILFEPNAAIFNELMHFMKKVRLVTHSKFILVGSHITATVREFFESNPIIDFAIQGEFEFAVSEFLMAVKNQTSYSSVEGLVYRNQDNSVIFNNRTNPIEPLDNLPMPARHLFPAFFNTDMSVYNDGFCQHQPAFHMHTSRGCSFHCNFCDRVQVLFGGARQRFFSTERILNEMNVLKDAGAKEIYIDDDNFTSNVKHVESLCDEISKRKLKIPWSAMCDAISLTELQLKKMSESGCVGIKFGLDSADTNVLNAIRKPLKLEKLEAVIACAKKLHIKTHMSVVFGLSGETKESLHNTFRYACLMDVDSVQFSLATPLPGTRFYNDLKEQDLLTSENWSDLDGANRSIIKYQDFSTEYLESFIGFANRDWVRKKIQHLNWVIRQVRYSLRIFKSQGLKGIYKRGIRAITLLLGDAKKINQKKSTLILRF